jgi:hypothetical protein
MWADGRARPEEVFSSETDGWSLQGVRPANHPRTRLRQYATWARECPDWPAHARELALKLPNADRNEPTRRIRKTNHLPKLRTEIAAKVSANVIGGTRLDNLICDGLLPLIAATSDRDFESVWYHWFAGDLPPLLTSGLRQLGFFDGRTQPACHGAALGLLGWLLSREPRQ